MTMTDPIADMLSRLRNANMAYHEVVSMPSSSVKVRIAEILQKRDISLAIKSVITLKVLERP